MKSTMYEAPQFVVPFPPVSYNILSLRQKYFHQLLTLDLVYMITVIWDAA
jgi:hypothetical protein